MSEKRYELDVRMDMPKLLIDNNTNEKYDLLMVNDIERIVDLLNEQQVLINALKKENKELKEDLKKGFDVPIPYVENSMRRLRAEHKVDEQQDIINKQLDQIIELQDKYRILEFNHSRLEKRNKAQYEKISAQQAEIDYLKDLITAMKLDIKNAMQMLSRWNDE